MIAVKNITKQYGPITVLNDVDFTLGKGEKGVLVGPNGIGKSTLLRIIAGEEIPDSGVVQLPEKACLGYLPQELLIEGDETVDNYLRKRTGIQALEKQMDALVDDLSDPQKAEQYGELQSLFIRLDGYTFDHRMETILRGFGLGGNILQRSLATLSGGEKSKVGLAAILLKGVDVLILDEPTNNLDLPSLIWLESFLKDSSATCLLVSHDRHFVDKVVTYTFEIDWKTRSATTFRGNYTSYLEFKRGEFNRQMEQYLQQQEEIQEIEAVARENKGWAARGARQLTTDNDKYARGAKRDRAAKSAQRAKAMEKKIEQMDKVEKPVARTPLSMSLSAVDSPAGHHITLENVIVSYDSSFTLGPITLDIPFGKRIGILGSNGSGKSTLLKVITGEIKPTIGSVRVGSSLIIGNFMQSHENMKRDMPVAKALKTALDIDDQKMFQLLKQFQFDTSESEKLVGRLSPGGRARLMLAMFSHLGVNVLVLDEPTNHMDLEAIQALQDILTTYSGSVVLVSHDRFLLENVRLDETYLLSEGKLTSIENYQVYANSLINEAKRLVRRL